MTSLDLMCRSGMRFGMGIDSHTESACGEALIFDRIDDRAGGQTGHAEFYKIDSQDSLMEAMNISVSASISYMLSSVDASFSLSKERAVNDYSVNILLKAWVRNPPRYMVNPRLRPEAEAVYKRSPEEFRKVFGDYYIDEVHTGGEMLGLLVFHAHDESSRTAISASLDVSVGSTFAGGEIKASFSQTIVEMSKKSSLQITTFTSGGSGLVNATSMGELVQLYKNFNQSVQDHPIDYTITAKDFSLLPLPPGESWVANELRRQTIEQCGRNVINGLKQRSQVDYVLQYPNEFKEHDPAPLRAAQAQLGERLPQWARRANECAADTAQCNLSGLDPVTFVLPERLKDSDPLGSKLDWVQHRAPEETKPWFLERLLLSPMSDYVEYAGGRYKIFYNNGVPTSGIFWHPMVAQGAPCIVFGAIFQAYWARGKCEGTLGWPTTDEEPVSDGLNRMNNFEHGRLWWDAKTGEVHDGPLPEEALLRAKIASTSRIGDVLRPH